MTETPSAPALLRLLAWLSPAFPTGAFAYSHGIEWAVESRDIIDGKTLCCWIAEVLTYGAGRSDTILLRHAYRNVRDAPALAEIAALAEAAIPSRERASESLSQGTAFLLAARAWDCPVMPDPVAYAVAVGGLAGWHRIDEDIVAAAYLQAFTSNLISAAVRLVPLGQSTGLQVLAALELTILLVAHETHDAALDDIGGCAFRSDIAAMRHETQYTRLFRS
jgi:urease accessory protein